MEQLTKAGPRGVEFPMQFLFSLLPRGVEGSTAWEVELLSAVGFWVFYLLIPPLLTMRLFAEERGSGTLEVLLTAPLGSVQVVLSKFLACFLFYVLLWLPTLAYLPVLLDLGMPVFKVVVTPWSVALVGGLAVVVVALLLILLRLGTWSRIVALILLLVGGAAAAVGCWQHYHIDSQHVLEIPYHIDPMPVLACYLGLALAGAMFLALGMLVSSLTRSQMTAALVSVLLSLAFVVAGLVRSFVDSNSAVAGLLHFFSVPLHFSQDFGRGLIDTRHLVLYSSVALFCLFLTVLGVESKR